MKMFSLFFALINAKSPLVFVTMILFHPLPDTIRKKIFMEAFEGLLQFNLYFLVAISF